MAGLAADAVVQLEARAARGGRHVLGMAVEAERLASRVGDAEPRGHAGRILLAQRAEGAGMRIEMRPGDVFVAQHVGVVERFRDPVADAGGAGGDAQVARGRIRADRPGYQQQQDRQAGEVTHPAPPRARHRDRDTAGASRRR